MDYAEIIENLVEYWNVASLTGLSDSAAKAQEYLCTLSERYMNLAQRMTFDTKGSISWIYGREVN